MKNPNFVSSPCTHHTAGFLLYSTPLPVLHTPTNNDYTHVCAPLLVTFVCGYRRPKNNDEIFFFWPVFIYFVSSLISDFHFTFGFWVQCVFVRLSFLIESVAVSFIPTATSKTPKDQFALTICDLCGALFLSYPATPSFRFWFLGKANSDGVIYKNPQKEALLLHKEYFYCWYLKYILCKVILYFYSKCWSWIRDSIFTFCVATFTKVNTVLAAVLCWSLSAEQWPSDYNDAPFSFSVHQERSV